MFPLLLLLDAIVVTRQRSGELPQESGADGAHTALPAMASNRAAESVLACTLCVLHRCSFRSGESLLGMLQRLATLLQLPADTVSDEIREQVRAHSCEEEWLDHVRPLHLSLPLLAAGALLRQ